MSEYSTLDLHGLCHCEVKSPSPQQLIDSQIPDEYVTAIWVGFKTQAGKSYEAVHVFSHPHAPYILLCSKDKEHDDFRTAARVVGAYTDGRVECVSDRGSDICCVIRLREPLTQRLLGQAVEGRFYKEKFIDPSISVAYYKVPEDLLPLIREMGGTRDSGIERTPCTENAVTR